MGIAGETVDAGETDPAARRSSQGGPIGERREEEKEAGAVFTFRSFLIRALMHETSVREW